MLELIGESVKMRESKVQAKNHRLETENQMLKAALLKACEAMTEEQRVGIL